MKRKTFFHTLTKFEWCLWLASVCVVCLSFFCSGGDQFLNTIASLIGVTALIFVAKGRVIGQILCVIFAVFYGIISFYFHYYGEMITYLCMSAPMSVLAVVAWIRNPSEGGKEVKVHRLSRKQVYIMLVLTVVVTIAFYFILRALGTANLLFSTLSVTTSFMASYLTYCRSPYYAIAYAANDIVLIVLWILATVADIGYLPMVFCFIMFLVNDMYGFFNWRRMEKRQGF